MNFTNDKPNKLNDQEKLQILEKKYEIEYDKLMEIESEGEKIQKLYHIQNEIVDNIQYEIYDLSEKIKNKERIIKSKKYKPIKIEAAKKILEECGYKIYK